MRYNVVILFSFLFTAAQCKYESTCRGGSYETTHVLERWPNDTPKIVELFRLDSSYRVLTTYYKNGLQESETNFFLDRKHGLSKQWFINGKLRTKEIFDNDQLVYSLEFFTDGSISRESRIYCQDTIRYEDSIGNQVVETYNLGNIEVFDSLGTLISSMTLRGDTIREKQFNSFGKCILHKYRIKGKRNFNIIK